MVAYHADIRMSMQIVALPRGANGETHCKTYVCQQRQARLAVGPRRGPDDERPHLEGLRILALYRHHDLPEVVQRLAAGEDARHRHACVDITGLQHLVPFWIRSREDALKRKAVRPELVEIGGEDDLPEIVQGRPPERGVAPGAVGDCRQRTARLVKMPCIYGSWFVKPMNATRPKMFSDGSNTAKEPKSLSTICHVDGIGSDRVHDRKRRWLGPRDFAGRKMTTRAVSATRLRARP